MITSAVSIPAGDADLHAYLVAPEGDGPWPALIVIHEIWGLVAAIMSSVPAHQRGVAAGMRATFQNSATVLSIGIFFSLVIAGLSASLPTTLYQGLVVHDVPAAVARQIASLPPTASLFGALLGYNPVATLLPAQVLHALPPAQAAILTGTAFFPSLISSPFKQGIGVVFTAAAAMSVVAAGASWLRGGRPIAGVPVAVVARAG